MVAAQHEIAITREYIFSLLETVKDPEIPTISVVELGMIRDIRIDDDSYHIVITPTFSGCPAQDLILTLIQNCLREHDIDPCTIEIQHSPPWTVANISPSCFPKLTAAGIAPPVRSRSELQCPRCNSYQVQETSFFGATPCKSQYSCLSCKEVFEYFKGIGSLGTC